MIILRVNLADVDFWKNFWPNCWANFAANLVVGILLTGLIGWIIRRRQRVNLAMQTTLRVMEDRVTRAYFGIVNKGNVVMRKDDVHFHIFVREGRIPLKVLNRLSRLRRVKIGGNVYVELKDTLDRTVFSGSATAIADIERRTGRRQRLRILNEEPGEEPGPCLNIQYSETEITGCFPASARRER